MSDTIIKNELDEEFSAPAAPAMATPANTLGMGSVTMPANPTGPSSFYTGKIGSGDLAVPIGKSNTTSSISNPLGKKRKRKLLTYEEFIKNKENSQTK